MTDNVNPAKDIDIFTEALDAIGIEYTIRAEGSYKYLFIGERRDIYSMSDCVFNSFSSDDIDIVTARHDYFEFDDGTLASYSNS